MPIYNFVCSKCKKEHEELVPMGTKFINCGCGYTANKVPSLSNFHLKGSGWYKDGYSKPEDKS